jgi:Na+-transporting NADH:ubiquinone oxidoreductase subunit A
MSIHRIAKGLDIPLAGAPSQDVVHDGPAVAHVGWIAADFPGLKASVLVEPGARVLRGTPLAADKRDAALVHRSPVAGTVVAVHRGERRRLLSIVVRQDADPRPQVPLRSPSRPSRSWRRCRRAGRPRPRQRPLPR